MHANKIDTRDAGKCKLIKNTDANRNDDSKSVFNNVYDVYHGSDAPGQKYGFAISKWMLNVHKSCFWKCSKFIS